MQIFLFAYTKDKPNYYGLSEDIHDYHMKMLLKKQYISLDDALFEDYISRDINVNEQMTLNERKLFEDTLYLQTVAVSAIALLYLLPEAITKWDDQALDPNNITAKWKDNVAAGPIIDQDEFGINYIGHPISGALYYVIARNNGFNEFESYLYSFFLSTFVWEYGWESLAEIPSTQDIISTPLAGAFIGEGMYYLEKQLDKNNGLIWGSRYLGNLSYFLLNPFGRMTQGMSEFFNVNITIKFETFQSQIMKEQDLYNLALIKPDQFNGLSYGVIINMKF